MNEPKDSARGGSAGHSGSASTGGSAGRPTKDNNTGGSLATGGSNGAGATGGVDSNSGGAGGAASGGTAGEGVAGGRASHACEDPVALDGGWILCDNIKVHRAQPGACSYRPRPRKLEHWGDPADDECLQDSDCTEKPNGYCETSGVAFRRHVCFYGCLEDKDCGANSVCVCAQAPPYSGWQDAPAGTCHPTDGCKSDADCGSGFMCTPYDASAGCYMPTFGCESAKDTCAVSEDCEGFAFCAFDGEKRSCEPEQCVID